MGWSYGYHRGRDIGYGVPAECDYPGCREQIDRGLSYVCGSEPYGGEHGCGLFFCGTHLKYYRHFPRDSFPHVQLCTRCYHYRPAFDPKPDTLEWVAWKLSDESWAQWRAENRDEVAAMQARLLVPA